MDHRLFSAQGEMGCEEDHPGGIGFVVWISASTFNGQTFHCARTALPAKLTLSHHQSFVYAMYDLVDNPAYMTLLRDELLSTSAGHWWDNLGALPLLDSFLKESARLSPSDSISLRRKALTTFTFNDGTVVPKGSWACVPQRAIQGDAAYYDKPAHFDGHRFVKSRNALTDIGPRFPFWGLGKRAWYVWLIAVRLRHLLITLCAAQAGFMQRVS